LKGKRGGALLGREEDIMVMERWSPVRGMRPWRPVFEDIEQELEEILGMPFLPRMWRRLPGNGMEWMPRIEMYEKDDKYVVKAELPGMKREDIDVSVVGDTMTIKGERKAESEIKKEDYHCCERMYGSFYRSIAMPSAVDVENIKAKYDNGMLEVTVPKAPQIKPKKVDISVK